MQHLPRLERDVCVIINICFSADGNFRCLPFRATRRSVFCIPKSLGPGSVRFFFHLFARPLRNRSTGSLTVNVSIQFYCAKAGHFSRGRCHNLRAPLISCIYLLQGGPLASCRCLLYSLSQRLKLDVFSDCFLQVAYYGLLQLFLTRRAVYLLVWNASQEGCNESGATCTEDDLQALGILPWLTALSFRLPGGDVILVGNKCDLRSGAQDSAAHAASRVESACRDWLARVCSSGGRAVEIEKGTSLTSCALPGWWAYLTSGVLRGLAWISGYKMGWPCDWKAGAMSGNRPPSLVDRIVRAGDNGPLRAEKMVLPQSWELALSFLRDLSDNERYGFCVGWAGTKGYFCFGFHSSIAL